MRKTALNHAMLNVDTLSGEFCLTLNLQGIFGSLRAGACAAPFRAFGANAAGVVKGLISGSGAMIFSRITQGTIRDFEGVTKISLANELRFLGARRVENGFSNTEEFENAYWEKRPGTTAFDNTTEIQDPNGGHTATKVVYDGTGSAGDHRLRVQNALVVAATIGRKFRTAVYLRSAGGSLPLRLTNDFGDSKDITVTDQWQRFSVLATSIAGRDYKPTIVRHQGGENDPFTCYTWHPMAEEVSGQTNQNPSMYVSNGVESGDYHGTGADGVAYYDYENGNTVDPASAIVTAGKAGQRDLTTDIRALFEPEATNYADGADDLSGGPETIDLTAAGTGQYTLSVYGSAAVTVAAGTATGTGFAQATEGSPVTFSLTGAGTVTLTLDSGVLDTTNGLAEKQVEKSAVASTWIPSSGSPAARASDDGFQFAARAGNASAENGTLVFDFVSSVASGDLVAPTAVFGVANAVDNVIGMDSSAPQLKSYDGSITAGVTLAFAADNTYRCAVRWNAASGRFQVGYRDIDGAGSWQWGTEAAFDGAFASGSWINIFLTLSAYGTPTQIAALDLYGRDIGRDAIESGF